MNELERLKKEAKVALRAFDAAFAAAVWKAAAADAAAAAVVAAEKSPASSIEITTLDEEQSK